MVRHGRVFDRLLTEKAAKRVYVFFWSVYGFLIVGILFPIIFPIQTGERPRNSCLSNLKQIQLASMMYSNDYDDRMPTTRWMEGLHPYLRTDEVFHDPDIKGRPYGYALNRVLVKADTDSIKHPEKTPSYFDSTAEAPDYVSRFRLPSPPRHGDHSNVAYADGHAKAVKP